MLQIAELEQGGRPAPVKLPRGTNIESIGALIHYNISGTGLRKLDPKFKKSALRHYRIVKPFVLLVFAFIDGCFRNGKIFLKGAKFPLFWFQFGNEWEMDEKVVPVSPRYAKRNGYHSTKRKGKRIVFQVMVLNIFDRKTHFCIISMLVGKGTVKETKAVLRLAFRRAGHRPRVIYLDETLTHENLANKGFLGVEFKIVPKIGSDISQVHIAEGYHNLMDRKLQSGIHGYDAWLLKAIWVQYNFVEPKSDLGNRTPATVASNTKALFELTWADLLSMAFR